MEQTLTVVELADHLRVSPATIRRRIRSGELNSYKNASGKRVISRESVLDYLGARYKSAITPIGNC